MTYILTIIVCLFVGYQFGWIGAHVMVAKECERLGKFFVGKKVYECNKISEVE